ncbi:MAG: acyl-CoA dehydrogenase family protein, partial [Actinobacteria bacterium]|nr:acyl-CoA dehydrogenase family protein [Actinomycetota bacterium]
MTDTTSTDAATAEDPPQGSAVDDELLIELRSWLADNWDPDLTVGEWWERLGLSGWAAPGLPANAYGRGLSRNDSVRVQAAIAEHGALGAPGGLGLLLAAPTIATHGTQPQIDRYVRRIVTGVDAWCQLFSEPGAGSDLAGLTTRAVPDGDEFVVNGQKVWTSLGHTADMGMLIARTDPDVPKHQGITWFAFEMHQPGVEVRGLREMTGHAMFNEVFLTDARVGVDAIIGDRNNGWAVTNTTLVNERAGLGSGGGSGAASLVSPGSVADQLGARAGDFAPKPGGTRKGGGGAIGMLGSMPKLLQDLARSNGRIEDPTLR